MKTQIDLYKLPKDVIVKLFLTLQDDLLEDNEKYIQEMIDEVNDIAERTRMYKCFKKGCKKYYIESKFKSSKSLFLTCESHDTPYGSCLDHIKESNIVKFRLLRLCKTCIEGKKKEQIAVAISYIYEYFFVTLIGDQNKAGYLEEKITNGEIMSAVPEIIKDLEGLLDKYYGLDDDNRLFLEKVVESYGKNGISEMFIVDVLKAFRNHPYMIRELNDLPIMNEVIKILNQYN